MSTVKAKFRCSRIEDHNFGHSHGSRYVFFQAVYGTAGDNADYSKATPSGELRIQIDKETPAYDTFQPGKEYYLTFEEAPAQ